MSISISISTYESPLRKFEIVRNCVICDKDGLRKCDGPRSLAAYKRDRKADEWTPVRVHFRPDYPVEDCIKLLESWVKRGGE
jgi:hypothetical protein